SRKSMGAADCRASSARKVVDTAVNGAKFRPKECKISTRLTRCGFAPVLCPGTTAFFASRVIAGKGRSSKHGIKRRKNCLEKKPKRNFFSFRILACSCLQSQSH